MDLSDGAPNLATAPFYQRGLQIVAEGLNTHRTPSIPFHSPTTCLYPVHTLKGHYHTPSLAMDKLEYRMAILIRIDILVEKPPIAF